MRVMPRCDVDGQVPSIVLFQIAVSSGLLSDTLYEFVAFVGVLKDDQLGQVAAS